MGFVRFWSESFKHAFTKAWIGMLAVSGALAILIPCARLRLLSSKPGYQTFFDILEHYWTGWILIAAFFVLLLARAAYAPFLIYKQAANEITTTEVQREELRGELATERDTKAMQARRSEQIDAMSKLWVEGTSIVDSIQNADQDFDLVKAQASDWFTRVIDWLTLDWGKMRDADYFRQTRDGYDNIALPFPKILAERNALFRDIYQRVRNLRVILDREMFPTQP
jgi:hypothetical protein